MLGDPFENEGVFRLRIHFDRIEMRVHVGCYGRILERGGVQPFAPTAPVGSGEIEEDLLVLPLRLLLGGGKVKYLTAGEIAVRDSYGPGGRDLFRAMAYWAKQAGCEHLLDYKKK